MLMPSLFSFVPLLVFLGVLPFSQMGVFCLAPYCIRTWGPTMSFGHLAHVHIYCTFSFLVSFVISGHYWMVIWAEVTFLEWVLYVPI